MTHKTVRYFVILGAMRTGSNYLERALDQFPNLACFGELFNPSFIGSPNRDDFPDWSVAERDKAPLALLERMIESANANIIPGFRLFQDHDPRVFEHVLHDETCAKVILHRNPLDSYVSLKIAQETGQWILGGIAHRKSAKIQFSEVEFASFLFDKDRFYQRINDALNHSGQAAFSLQYTDLKSVPTLNGLAQFLGSQTKLERFDEPLKRQNPEPLSKKVSNFDAMNEALSRQFSLSLASNQSPEFSAHQANTPIIASETLNLAFAPIAGVPSQHVIQTMTDAGPVERFTDVNNLETWMTDRSGVQVVTMTTHPLERAYHVFYKHILPGDAVFTNLRRRLIKNFGLPNKTDKTEPAELREGFEVFLTFLVANLAGQTAVRIAKEWDLQSNHMAKFAATIPISQIIRFDGIKKISRLHPILNVFVPSSELDVAPLKDIYSDSLESLCKEAFLKDYTKLGYGKWQAT